MSTGLKWKRLCGAVLLGAAILCMASLSPARAVTPQSHKKAAKKQQPPPLPPLPSGPTGPVQQVPLEAIPAVPPQVSYQNNELTIVAPNSTLADILRAVRKQTGAEIEVPAAPERVVTHLGPGPARDVVAELLNGSRFNYVLLGSPENDAALTRVVLVAKTGSQDIPPPQPTTDSSLGPQANVNNGQPQDQMQDADAEAADDNSDDNNADQAQPAEADQQQAQPTDQPVIKTPQQLLQEMQQRQMQLQQAQPPGQPPIPGPGRPPGSPQEQ